MKNLIIPLLLLIILSGCKNEPNNNQLIKNNELNQNKPLNVILLIGDGMGLSEVSASICFNEGKSNFERFKQISFINTSSATHKITDSGAGATAFAIDQRSYNGSIGVGPDSLSSANIVEILSRMDYSTGIVATCQLTHATPAAFFAHVKNRYQMDDIAKQLIHSPIDFFAAGGTKYFNHREDGLNLLDSLRNNGFIIDTNSLEGIAEFDTNKKYGFLMAYNAMPKYLAGRGDYLPNATQKAIDYLSMNQNGFFLMVEGSQIDWGGHDNDADYLISEMLDFDKTIGVALDFAEKNGNTLVIVLGDHETGGFTLGPSYDKKMEGDYNQISPTFSTKEHSAALVPVFTFGEGSETFTGIYKNSEIFHKILALTGFIN